MKDKRLTVKHVLAKALENDEASVKQLFAGFFGTEEEVIGCGYLGSVGHVLTTHSFWCVTKERVCALEVKRGGEVRFTGGYHEHINSHVFLQPSLIPLWGWIIIAAIATLGIGLVLAPAIAAFYYRARKSGVVFWVREGIPIYMFSDRQGMRQAQSVAALAVNAKRGRVLT